MFVAPRPIEEDDPLFAVRLSIMPLIGLAVALVLQSPMPAIYPAIMFTLMATNRQAIDPKKVIGSAVVVPVLLFVMSWITSLTASIPLVMTIITALAFIGGFYLVAKTGSPVGMIVIVCVLTISVMVMTSHEAMIIARNEMSKAALLSGFFTLLLYAFIPTSTRQKPINIYVPHQEHQRTARVLIRTLVLLLLAAWFYTFLDASNVWLGMAGVFVLTFPTRETLYSEARERSFATLMGGFAAIFLLVIFTSVAHIAVIFGCLYLGCLYFTQQMIHGRLPAPVYQYATSVMVAIVCGGLATQEPTYAFLTRAVLTMAGAVGAAFLTSLLESLFLSNDASDPHVLLDT